MVRDATKSMNFNIYICVEMGHDARTVSGFQRTMMGRGQVIQKLVDVSGQVVFAAGCDLRSDGQASPEI